MIEQWIKWEPNFTKTSDFIKTSSDTLLGRPINSLIGKYSMDCIFDTLENFTVLLSEFGNKNNKVKVIFDNFVHVYRCNSKICGHKLMRELSEKYGKEFCVNWTFFKVENSEYLKWISDQSYTISDDRELKHFCFLGENLILDVVTPCEPRFEFIDN